jgi:uncharacterized protein YciI
MMEGFMAFLVLCMDKPDGLALRKKTRSVHLEYMIRHKTRVVFGGPLTTDDGDRTVGSVMMLDFPDRPAVEVFLRDEPYTRAGLFESVIIRRWRQVVPEREPNFLENELARERAAQPA